MAVRIVQYYPSSSGLRPVARVLVILIGLILFVAGILAIALDAVVLGSAFYPDSSTEVDLE
jgi:hypothetical protein